MVCGAGPGQMVVWVPRCLERLDPTHSSCQERRTLARVAQPKLQASTVAPRPPGPALRPGSLAAAAADTPRMWVGLGAASNSTRGHSSFRNTGDSIELAETRLFGKQPHLWENTSRLRSLLSISLCFPKVKKQKQKEKKKTHIFREKVFFTGPESCTSLCPHWTRSVKFSGKTPRHFSSSLCWFQSLSFTPMSQPSSLRGSRAPKSKRNGEGGPCVVCISLGTQ